MGTVGKIGRKPKKSKSDDKLKVSACDLFAGAGGFSLGAHLAGINVAAAIEWDKYACQTYRANLIDTGLASTHLFEEDISKLAPNRVKLVAGFHERPCDILLGGPPCQGFSAHRLNDAGVDDPRNTLLLRYFEYVRVLRPVFFLVENVPGLLWPKHKKFLNAFYELADRADYGVLEPKVINARDFGVPQNRRRVFILGFDRRRVDEMNTWPPKATHVSPDALGELPHWVAASVAFKRALAGDPNNIHMKHCPELVETFARTPANGGSRRQSGRILPCHEDHSGHSDVYGRIDPSIPGPTMTTACINPSYVERPAVQGCIFSRFHHMRTVQSYVRPTGAVMTAGLDEVREAGGWIKGARFVRVTGFGLSCFGISSRGSSSVVHLTCRGSPGSSSRRSCAYAATGPASIPVGSR